MTLCRRAHPRITGTPCKSKYEEDQLAQDGDSEIDMPVAAVTPAIVSASAGIVTVKGRSNLSVGKLGNIVVPSTIVTLGCASSPRLFGTSGIGSYSAVHLMDDADGGRDRQAIAAKTPDGL
jgi:hypothetical protein